MAYLVKQEKFEGPLDLLLQLIQEQKLSINEISLAKVTDGFIHYLRTLEGQIATSREVLAEFLVIAATLLLIKSKSLLPELHQSAEEEQSIRELESRLAEYQRVKELTGDLGRLAAGGQKSFSREAFSGRPQGFSPPQRLTPTMLAEAFRRVLEYIPKIERLAEGRIQRVISLEEKIRQLQTLLSEKVERAFSEVVAGARERLEVIVSFLAILELMKQKLITIHQREPFGAITIRRRPPSPHPPPVP